MHLTSFSVLRAATVLFSSNTTAPFTASTEPFNLSSKTSCNTQWYSQGMTTEEGEGVDSQDPVVRAGRLQPPPRWTEASGSEWPPESQPVLHCTLKWNNRTVCSTVQVSGLAHFKAFPTCFFKLPDDQVCIEIDRSGKCESQGSRRLCRHHRSQLVSLYIDMGTVDCAAFV